MEHAFGGCAALVEGGLKEAGTAIAVLARREDGVAAFTQVNASFARLFGLSAAGLIGAPLDKLLSLVDDTAGWAALQGGLNSSTGLQRDLKLHVAGHVAWFAFRLTCYKSLPGEPMTAILLGHDVTRAKLSSEQEESSRRLLAGLFLSVAAPVVLVAEDGLIKMANPAFHHLLGYAQGELRGIRVQDITAPEFAAEAAAARARQLVDGDGYDLRIDTLGKSGSRIPIHLSSRLLRDGDRQFRVVTLIPRQDAARLPTARDKGELRAVSLAAFKTAFGNKWERVAVGAMMKAEHILRRRLQPDDVLSRNEDGFVVWFDSADSGQNEQVLATTVREIRLRFLTDFGAEVASHVQAVVVPGLLPGETKPVTRPAPPAPGGGFEETLLRRRHSDW